MQRLISIDNDTKVDKDTKADKDNCTKVDKGSISNRWSTRDFKHSSKLICVTWGLYIQ